MFYRFEVLLNNSEKEREHELKNSCDDFKTILYHAVFLSFNLFVTFLLMSCKLLFGLFHSSSAYTCIAKSLGDIFSFLRISWLFVAYFNFLQRFLKIWVMLSRF